MCFLLPQPDRLRSLFRSVAAIVCGLIVAAQLPADVVVAGSSMLQPSITAIAEQFSEETGIELAVGGGGSDAGIDAVLDGTAELAMISRPLSAEEAELVAQTAIAHDALSVIVNAANSLPGVSTEQLQGLFSGDIGAWSELDDFDARVAIVSREADRTALQLFETHTGLAHHERDEPGPAGSIARSAYRIATESEAVAVVGGTPGAVAYASWATAERLREQGMPIRIVALEGQTPDANTIAAGDYPIVVELSLAYTELSPEGLEFLSFITSETGQAVLSDYGLIPITDGEQPSM